jgi:hypothetical protein
MSMGKGLTTSSIGPTSLAYVELGVFTLCFLLMLMIATWPIDITAPL